MNSAIGTIESLSDEDLPLGSLMKLLSVMKQKAKAGPSLRLKNGFAQDETVKVDRRECALKILGLVAVVAGR
jgi:hypothetical protein